MTNDIADEREALRNKIAEITGGWLTHALYDFDIVPTNGQIAWRTKKINDELVQLFEKQQDTGVQFPVNDLLNLIEQNVVEWKLGGPRKVNELIKADRQALLSRIEAATKVAETKAIEECNNDELTATGAYKMGEYLRTAIQKERENL